METPPFLPSTGKKRPPCQHGSHSKARPIGNTPEVQRRKLSPLLVEESLGMMEYKAAQLRESHKDHPKTAGDVRMKSDRSPFTSLTQYEGGYRQPQQESTMKTTDICKKTKQAKD